MSIKFNEQLLLWGLGVIQPASPAETLEFLKLVYPAVSRWPNDEYLEDIFDTWLENKYVVMLNKKYKLFSLTAFANQRMDVKLRRQRDKARITLLRHAYDASLKVSGRRQKELDGVSPSSDARYISQEGSRPVSSGSAASRAESTRHRARTYWPRVSEQLNLKVGLTRRLPDKLHYRYYSFPTLKSLQQASNDAPAEADMSLTQLAYAIGITPRLLTSFTHKKVNHYRHFSIQKKGGGEREICSPKYFLKTVLYWLGAYLLKDLRVHESCHAYTKGKSIITNASPHLNRAYVANLDIENFFGNVTPDHIIACLDANKIGPKLTKVISDLVTYDGALPQGAPTSPIISNAVLYDFDKRMTSLSEMFGLSYSRYADDITISGESIGSVKKAINFCGKQLNQTGFSLNDKKTRIATQNSSQRVTGVVVNEKLQPPREYRRKVRALFHNASQRPADYVDSLDILRGHLSYLMSYELFKKGKVVAEYKQIIDRVLIEKDGNSLI